MNILPVSSPKRHHDKPLVQTGQSNNTQGKPWRRRAAHQGRPLHTLPIISVAEPNAFSIDGIPKAICDNPHCHCRSTEAMYCASWTGNQENCDPTLVSVIVRPRKSPPASPLSLPEALQTILKRTRPHQRATSSQPSVENLPQADTPEGINPSYGDMFLQVSASRDFTGDGRQSSGTTSPADTMPTLKNAKDVGIGWRRPSLHGSSHYLIDVINGSQAPETYVADVSAEKVGIARITPPDSQSPSPPKKTVMLHQPSALPSHYNPFAIASYHNALPEKGNQEAIPSPEQHRGDCIPSLEIDAKPDTDENGMKRNPSPKISRPPLYRNNSQGQRTQSNPKVTFRLGKNRTKLPDPANVLDPSRARAGAPPPAPRSAHITIAYLLNDEHGRGGLPSDPSPGFDDFTVAQPSYEYQPMYWGESSTPYSYKRPLVAPLGEEGPETFAEVPRPVQKVPLELQWKEDDDEPKYVPPLFPLEVTQPKKLDKGKGRAPESLLHEEMRAAGELYAGENDAIDYSDFMFDDEEDVAGGPPPSPCQKPRSLPTLLPKPAFNQVQDDDEEAIARGPPPSPRPGQISLKRPLSPPLNQEQVDALRLFNLSNPAYSIPSPEEDSDVPDIDTDTESVFELKNSKKLRLKHVVDRGKLLTETIAYHFQTPPSEVHPNIYTKLSPWEKEQALLLYDQTDVVPYMERYAHVQTWDEEEDDAPYIQNACSGTIPASMKDDYKVAHFADEHLFRRSNRTGEIIWKEEKVYFIRDWHPYQSRYAFLHPRMYTAFERRLDGEKGRWEDLKDSDDFRVPPPPRRRLSRARGATPGVEQSLRDWLRTTEFSLTKHDRRMQRQEEMKREAVRVAATPDVEQTWREWFSETEMSFTDADRRREMQERMKRKAIREAGGGPASGDMGIGPARKGPSGIDVLLQKGRTAAAGSAQEAPREEKKRPSFLISSGGVSDILRRASQRESSPPLAPGPDHLSLREASPAPGPRGWKTKEQAQDEAERLEAEQEERIPKSPQDIPIPSIEDAEEAIEDGDLDDNALRASPLLPDRGSPFTDRAGHGIKISRNRSESPPRFDILDAYRTVHRLPARRYSSGNLPAPRNGQRLRALGSRVGRLDALADVMILPEWEPRHFQDYVEMNRQSKVPKIVHTLAPETEAYDDDADDLDDKDIDDMMQGGYDDEQEWEEVEREARLRCTTSEESREDEEGDDPDAWRSEVPESCLRESVEPEKGPRELFPDRPDARHEDFQRTRQTDSPLGADFTLDVYRFEHGLQEREYGPRLVPEKTYGQRDFEARPFKINTPLPSAGLHPHTDGERLRAIMRSQADAEVPRIVCTMPTPEREAREGVLDNEYHIVGPEDGGWPTASEEGRGEVIEYDSQHEH